MPDRIDWKTRIAAALAAAGHGPDPDIVEELAQHARATYAAARADGHTDADAVAHVDREIAGWCADAELLTRPRKRLPALVAPPAGTTRATGLLQDLRYSVRVLRRQPGFAALSVTTLALGVAATTTLFSVVYGVLLKPLPWTDADRLIRIYEERPGMRKLPNVMTNGTYRSWAAAPAVIDQIAGWSATPATVQNGDEQERIRVAQVTSSLLPMLQARPLHGALLSTQDDAPDSKRVMVGEGYWRRRLGADPAVVGRVLTIDSLPYTVVGVLPQEFAFPDRETQLWTPLYVPPVLDPRNPDSRAMRVFGAIVRAKAGVTTAQIAAEGTARARAGDDPGMVAMALFGSNQPPEIRAVPMLEMMTSDVRPALIVLMAAVGLLFVIGIANVASLQLARAAARRRELSLRAALGAGLGRLARQLLVENAVLGGIGGAVGVALAWLAHRALPALLPAGFPRTDDIALSVPVAAFAIAMSVLATLLVGTLPILQTRRFALVQALNEDSLAPVGGSIRTGVARTRAVIMAGQVAIAAMLLVGAALLTRSFVALINVDRGFNPSNLLTATVLMPSPGFNAARRNDVIDRLLAAAAQAPGVTRAAVSSVIPLSNRDSLTGFRITPPGGEPRSAQAANRVVSPTYFDTLGIRVIEGRGLLESDSATSEPVVVVNRAFVQAYLNGSALGVEVPLGGRSRPGRENEPPQSWKIVGVVEDVTPRSVTDPHRPEMYQSARQVDGGINIDSPSIVLRTSGDPLALVPTLRDLVKQIDRTVLLDGVVTMDRRVMDSLAQPRLYSAVLVTFAVFAVVITAVGLFGVLSYMVSLRHREIGVRAALGARPGQIVRLVVAQGALMAVAGVVVGLTAAWMLGKYLTTFLYGVTSRDPVTFAAVAAALILVSLLACAGPAIRAARVDPLRALRR